MHQLQFAPLPDIYTDIQTPPDPLMWTAQPAELMTQSCYQWTTATKHYPNMYVECCFFCTCFHLLEAPCGLQGCKNKAHIISWPEIVKSVLNQGVDTVLLARAGVCVSLCVWAVCGVLFPCFWLSVPVQSIAWKDSSVKWPVMCWVGR